MKTLIAYATKHGATESVAKKLSKRLEGDVDLLNLKKDNNIDLSRYQKVIVGSSVYMGKIRKEANQFCTDRLQELKEKKLGIFICCMREADDAKNELNDSFPGELLDNAVTECFGGVFNFEKMNIMEKLIVKKVAGVKKTQSNISEEIIDKFASKVNAV